MINVIIIILYIKIDDVHNNSYLVGGRGRGKWSWSGTETKSKKRFQRYVRVDLVFPFISFCRYWLIFVWQLQRINSSPSLSLSLSLSLSIFQNLSLHFPLSLLLFLTHSLAHPLFFFSLVGQRRRRDGPTSDQIDEVTAMFGEDYGDFDEDDEEEEG